MILHTPRCEVAGCIGDCLTGYETANVVTVTEAVQDAMRKWIEAIYWATCEDVR